MVTLRRIKRPLPDTPIEFVPQFENNKPSGGGICVSITTYQKIYHALFCLPTFNRTSEHVMSMCCHVKGTNHVNWMDHVKWMDHVVSCHRVLLYHRMSSQLFFFLLILLSGYGDKPLVPNASQSEDDDENDDDDDDDDPWRKSKKERASFEEIFPSETARAKNTGKKQVSARISFLLIWMP